MLWDTVFGTSLPLKEGKGELIHPFIHLCIFLFIPPSIYPFPPSIHPSLYPFLSVISAGLWLSSSGRQVLSMCLRTMAVGSPRLFIPT